MTEPTPPPRSFKALLAIVGPGLVVAATGVGAGDMVAAAKAGATFGLPLLWTAALGTILKFALAEGVGRWQLATSSTVLEGWVRLFGPPVRIYFLLYFVMWTVIVAAALMSACGLAAHALFPQLSVRVWAVVHALAAMIFVWYGGYAIVALENPTDGYNVGHTLRAAMCFDTRMVVIAGAEPSIIS